VVNALPPIAQSPLCTSSSTHQVTPRMFSPSIETIASVSFCTISRRGEPEKTPSITFTLINGIPIHPLFRFRPALRRSAPAAAHRPDAFHARNTLEPLHPYHDRFQQAAARGDPAEHPEQSKPPANRDART
jgi:hypothetical protein